MACVVLLETVQTPAGATNLATVAAFHRRRVNPLSVERHDQVVVITVPGAISADVAVKASVSAVEAVPASTSESVTTSIILRSTDTFVADGITVAVLMPASAAIAVASVSRSAATPDGTA
jgi:hypothetical protein